MKKLVSLTLAIALTIMLNPLEATVSFLTSEKIQTTPISLGSNEDVFVTETKSIQIVTEVTKRVTITRKIADAIGPGGSEEGAEERDVKLSIQEGAYYLSLKPQRPHLDLDVENMKITGEAEGHLQIERQDGEKEMTFRIGHIRSQVGRSDNILKGELHITALGGFYRHVIPLTVVTKYDERTNVVEISAPPPAPPGSSPGDSPPGEEEESPPSEEGGESPPPSEGGESPPTGGGGAPTPPNTGGTDTDNSPPVGTGASENDPSDRSSEGEN